MDEERGRPRGVSNASSTSTSSSSGKVPQEEAEEERKLQLLYFFRRLLAEVVGTFILVYFHAGNGIVEEKGQISQEGKALANGLVLVGLIYALGEVGGAHFNPVVTTAFAIRGSFPFWLVPFYWLSQLAGAVIAASLLAAFFNHTWEPFGASHPGYDPLWGTMFFEALFTFVLVLVILSVTSSSHVTGVHGALAVGATVAFLTMFGGNLTSGSFNPARSLGAAFILGRLSVVWVFVAGPFIGGGIALIMVFLLRGRRLATEKEFALGSGKDVQPKERTVVN